MLFTSYHYYLKREAERERREKLGFFSFDFSALDKEEEIRQREMPAPVEFLSFDMSVELDRRVLKYPLSYAYGKFLEVKKGNRAELDANNVPCWYPHALGVMQEFYPIFWNPAVDRRMVGEEIRVNTTKFVPGGGFEVEKIKTASEPLNQEESITFQGQQFTAQAAAVQFTETEVLVLVDADQSVGENLRSGRSDSDSDEFLHPLVEEDNTLEFVPVLSETTGMVEDLSGSGTVALGVHEESRFCALCHKVFFKDQFSRTQWGKKLQGSKCPNCAEESRLGSVRQKKLVKHYEGAVQCKNEQNKGVGWQVPVVTLGNTVFVNSGEQIRKNCVKYPLWSVQDARMAWQRVIRQSPFLRNGYARERTKGKKVNNWYFVFSNSECKGHADFCGCQIEVRGIGLRNRGEIHKVGSGTLFSQLLELGAIVETCGIAEGIIEESQDLEKDRLVQRKPNKKKETSKSSSSRCCCW